MDLEIKALTPYINKNITNTALLLIFIIFIERITKWLQDNVKHLQQKI